MVVPVCFLVAAWTYAVTVNFVPAYRNPADRIGASDIGVEDAGAAAEERSIREDGEDGDDATNADGVGKGTEVQGEELV